jgi:hypothetical protein
MPRVSKTDKSLSGQIRSRYSLFAQTCLAFLVIGSVSFFLFRAGTGQGATIWKGYYTILAETTETGAIDYDDLARRIGAQEIISESSSMERISVLNGFTTVSAGELGTRLDILDPRFDDYLKNINRYFHTGNGYEIFYLKTDVHPLLTWISLSSYFSKSHSRFYMADYDPIEKIVFALIAALFIAFLLRLVKRDIVMKSVIIVGSLPWIVGLSGGSQIDLASFALVFPLFVSFSESLWSASIQRGKTPDTPDYEINTLFIRFIMLVTCVSIVSGIVIFAGSAGSLVVLFAGLFIDFLLAAILVSDTMIDKTPSRKTAKVPGKMIRKKSDKKSQRNGFRIFIFTQGLFAGLAIYLAVAPLPMPFEIPYPVVVEPKKSFSLASIGSLGSGDAESSLPDLFDYVTHSAFQEGFMFGMKYEFPDKSGIELPSFTREKDHPGVIDKRNLTIRQFDDAWLLLLLTRVENGSLAHLLVSQGEPVRVMRYAHGKYSGLGLAPLLSVIFFMMLAGAILFASRRLPMPRISLIRTPESHRN